MINENMVKGKWREIRGDLRAAWGKLTDDELEETKGNLIGIAGLVQQRYGIAQDEARQKIDAIVNRYKDDKEDKESLKDTESMGGKYEESGTRRVQ